MNWSDRVFASGFAIGSNRNDCSGFRPDDATQSAASVINLMAASITYPGNFDEAI